MTQLKSLLIIVAELLIYSESNLTANAFEQHDVSSGLDYKRSIKQHYRRESSSGQNCPIASTNLALDPNNAATTMMENTLPRTTTFPKEQQPSRRKQKEKAIEIALSFQTTPFNPPFWAQNCHLQTIGGAILRKRIMQDGTDFSYWPAKKRRTPLDEPCSWWDKRERIETKDGDFFHVDYKYVHGLTTMADGRQPSMKDVDNEPPLVVILHGLESSSYSPQVVDAAMAYISIGMDVACINFRGCSGEPNQIPGAYHLGFTDDLIFFLSELKRREGSSSSKRVFLCGFSLGANVVLKFLGEVGEAALFDYSVHGAAVGSAPFDLTKSAPKFAGTAFNRMVYDANFLRTLKQKVQTQISILGEDVAPYDLDKCLRAKTIADIEDAFIAPVYGFDNHWDYYEKTSAIHFLDDISVPTLVVNALDDPFFDPNCFPTETNRRPLRLHYTEYGGHLGYMFHDDYHSGGYCDKSEDLVQSSWFASELARFVKHVHDKGVITQCNAMY